MAEGKPPLSSRRYSWIGRAKEKETNGSSQDVNGASSTHSPAGSPGLFSKTQPSSTSINTFSTMDNAERPPKIKHRSSSSSLVRQQLDQQSQSNLERTQSHTNGDSSSRPSGSFSKLSLSNMMGGLSTLSLTRSSNEERGRGDNKHRSSSVSGRNQDDASDHHYRARSMSPFSRRRNSRARDSSPYEALKMSQSDLDSDNESTRRSIRPRNAFSQGGEDDDSMDDDSDADSEDSWSDDDVKFDPITTQNTEQNSLIPAADAMEHDGIEAPDPLGEGVNIVVPSEPYFPSTLNNFGRRNARRRKSTKYDTLLPLETSSPIFKRDRCTITVKQGDPVSALGENHRRSRKYIVASDLSEESKYAVEWGVGTVIRDGDELFVHSPCRRILLMILLQADCFCSRRRK